MRFMGRMYFQLWRDSSRSPDAHWSMTPRVKTKNTDNHAASSASSSKEASDQQIKRSLPFAWYKGELMQRACNVATRTERSHW